MDFIPAVSPRFDSPYHLKELVDAFEGVVKGTIKNGRYVVTVPMRHGKSFTCMHMIAWALLNNPCLEFMYISYGASFAQRQGRKSRSISIDAGVELSKDHNTIQEWHTSDDGKCVFTGIEGEIAGRGADIVIIDDPIKSRLIAESADERNKATDFVQEAISRLNKGGAAFMVSARWHPDDPSGQLLRTGDYTHIHKRAIEDEGLPTEHALWPEQRDLETLKFTRYGKSGKSGVGEYNWYSWYQGEPRPPDSGLFRSAPHTYQALPNEYQAAIGVDLGFSVAGDASATCVAARGVDGKTRILRMDKYNRNAPSVAAGLYALKQSYPSAPMFSYTSGPEKGTIDLMRENYGLDIIAMPARFNKYARAMATADAWNAGKIMVPHMTHWDLDGFISEVLNFSGGEGESDDRVDAMVSAFDGLEGGGCSTDVPGFHGKRCF
jgi:predicted phage terminase large subunit-like protein